MNTAMRPMYKWQDLPWKKIQRQVFKLQKRIYQASQRDDIESVHKLQRLLIKSWSARCLAVRKVTQDNRGKNTAGVDGVKSLNPTQRLELASKLKLSDKVKPTLRVWIDKPGKAEKRPLGLPTMQNRAEQALGLLALQPQWEAKFEANSYGFRPGRCCHDAIEAIFNAVCHKAKYVLDADIAKCFDRIDHQALLAKLETFPKMRRTIRAWLKAGVIDGDQLFPTTEGTPQGGVASPLLANIALHGLETAVVESHPKAIIVRYADDLVVLHEDLQTIEQAKQTVSDWLAGLGLELKPSKTKITHTLNEHEGNVGFDFLGVNVRQHRVGKTHSGKTTGRYPKRLGYKTIIKPSKDALHKHLQQLRTTIRTEIKTPQARLIFRLNPVIKGWTNYYAKVSASDDFSRMAHLTFVKLKNWARRRHPNKPWKWIAHKYWRLEQGKWDFAPKNGAPLYRHFETPIKRHIKVRADKSPYDGDWAYWSKRTGQYPGLSKLVATLLKKQQGKCATCKLYFSSEDNMEVDHIISKSNGGKDGYENLQLLHPHCHHQKSAKENRLTKVLMSRANLKRSRMMGNYHVRF